MASRPPEEEQRARTTILRQSYANSIADRNRRALEQRQEQEARAAAREWSRSEAGQRSIRREAEANRGLNGIYRRGDGRYFGLSTSQAIERETRRQEEQFAQIRLRTVRRETGRRPVVPLQRADVVNTPNQETNRRNTSTRRAANTTSRTSSNTAVSAPQIAPSDQQQPQLELNTNLRNRNIVEGTGTAQVFDINSFRSEMITNDVLPAHAFLVTFSPFRVGFPENAPLNNFVVNKRNTLVMRCENVTIPTPTLLKDDDVRRYGYGPVEKVGYGVQFGDISMTWIVDNKAEIIDFMYQWMNTIVSHDSPNTNMARTTDINGFRPGLGGYNPFEVGYKDAYSNPIVRIYVYNRQNQTVTEYEMYDVFPQNIQTINMAWGNENEIQKLNVTFSYTNMKMKAPLKTTEEQLNYLLEGRINPYEERIQPEDRGGRATSDRSDSPIGEVATTSANASVPNAAGTTTTTSPTVSTPTVALPTTHNFTLT